MARIVHIYGKPHSVRGVGDVIEHYIRPVAKAIRWPCEDIPKERLKPGSPCSKIRNGLNKALPFGEEKRK